MPTKADADSAQLQRKARVIDEIRTRLGAADAAVLPEYRGLTCAEIANLRAALRPAATDYKVFKNTLARRAAGDAGLTELVEHLEGPVPIAFVAATVNWYAVPIERSVTTCDVAVECNGMTSGVGPP